MFICAVKCLGNTVKHVGNTDGECESGFSSFPSPRAQATNLGTDEIKICYTDIFSM